jgi:hypothetical protein
VAETGGKSSGRFWLYPLAVCRFAFGIKNAKSKPIPEKIIYDPDDVLWSNFQAAYKKVIDSANAGGKTARSQLDFFNWGIYDYFRKDIEKKARAGQAGSPHPISILFEMADFSISILFWLAEHQRDNIKKYARKRWAWPGLFHLSKREQNKYQALLPKFDKSGTKIIRESPIELGKNLGLQVNANLTKGDLLFQIAANAVNNVALLDREEMVWNGSWLWLRAHNKSFSKTKKLHKQAEKFLASLGFFTKGNWPKWKPVFETYLTVKFAPPEIKFKILPKDCQSNLHVCYGIGAHMEWLENLKKTKSMSAIEETQLISDMKKRAALYDNAVPAQEYDHPDIKKIVLNQKSNRSKWNALKKEILKRIENLAPES